MPLFIPATVEPQAHALLQRTVDGDARAREYRGPSATGKVVIHAGAGAGTGAYLDTDSSLGDGVTLRSEDGLTVHGTIKGTTGGFLSFAAAGGVANVQMTAIAGVAVVQAGSIVSLERAGGIDLQLLASTADWYAAGSLKVRDTFGATTFDRQWQAGITGGVTYGFATSAGAGGAFVLTGQQGAANSAGGLVRIAAGSGGAGAGGNGADLDLRSGDGDTDGDVTIRRGSQTAILIEGAGNVGRITIGESGYSGRHAINVGVSTSGTAGGADPLPATPEGYIDAIVNGTNVVIPFYLT